MGDVFFRVHPQAATRSLFPTSSQINFRRSLHPTGLLYQTTNPLQVTNPALTLSFSPPVKHARRAKPKKLAASIADVAAMAVTGPSVSTVGATTIPINATTFVVTGGSTNPSNGEISFNANTREAYTTERATAAIITEGASTIPSIGPTNTPSATIPSRAVAQPTTKKRKRSLSNDSKDPNPRATKLRASNPVQADVSGDIWNHIFGFAEPKTLLACRQVEYFEPILVGHPAVWRDSRRYTHGEVFPEPLENLSEEAYADLRECKGCQVAGCTDKLARKAYWAYRHRWCKQHFGTETLKHPQAIEAIAAIIGPQDATLVQKLLACLTPASLDSWGNYSGPGAAMHRFSTTIYSTVELQDVIGDFHVKFPDLVAADAGEMDAFYATKQAEATRKEEFAKEVEEAVKEAARLLKLRNAVLKKERIDYFVQKAAQMQPPMSPEVLERCPSYVNSIKIPKKPNSMCWGCLGPKLEKERVEVEAETQKAATDQIMTNA